MPLYSDRPWESVLFTVGMSRPLSAWLEPSVGFQPLNDPTGAVGGGLDLAWPSATF